MKRWFSALLVFAGYIVPAQLPESDIWLFTLRRDKSGKMLAKDARNISNRKGYDHQPRFSGDGRFVYYSSWQSGQTDLFAFDTRKKQTKQLTFSAENEYSPAEYPGGVAGTALSAVVVEKDSVQRVHIISLNDGKQRKIMPPDSVGYYTFLSADTLIYYKVGKPSTLNWLSLQQPRDRQLAANVCRTFWPVNRHTIVFGIKDSARVSYYLYDFALMKTIPFANHEPGSEDIWWHPEFGLLIAHGKKILRYDIVKQNWETLFDLSGSGITRISRFVFDTSGNRLAVADNLNAP